MKFPIRNTYGIVSIVLMVTIGVLSLYPIPQPELLKPIIGIDKLVHTAMYMVLAIAMHLEFRRGWVALTGAILYGGIIEILQACCTHGMRSGDWWDWMADILGAAIGVSIIYCAKRPCKS